MSKDPRIVRHAEVILDLLSTKASELEEQADKIEMALKDVRWATNREERTTALRELEEEIATTSNLIVARGRAYVPALIN